MAAPCATGRSADVPVETPRPISSSSCRLWCCGASRRIRRWPPALARIHASGDLLDFLQDLTERALGEMPQMPEGAVVPALPARPLLFPDRRPARGDPLPGSRGDNRPRRCRASACRARACSRRGGCWSRCLLEPNPSARAVQPDIRYPARQRSLRGPGRPRAAGHDPAFPSPPHRRDRKRLLVPVHGRDPAALRARALRADP